MSLEQAIQQTAKEIKQDLRQVPVMFRAPLEKNINRILTLLFLMAQKIEGENDAESN